MPGRRRRRARRRARASGRAAAAWPPARHCAARRGRCQAAAGCATPPCGAGKGRGDGSRWEAGGDAAGRCRPAPESPRGNGGVAARRRRSQPRRATSSSAQQLHAAAASGARNIPGDQGQVCSDNEAARPEARRRRQQQRLGIEAALHPLGLGQLRGEGGAAAGSGRAAPGGDSLTLLAPAARARSPASPRAGQRARRPAAAGRA